VPLLVAICQDTFYATASFERSTPVEVIVTVDGRTPAQDAGETGVAMLAGPRIGPRALEAIACNATVEVIGVAEDGQPLSLGRRSRTVRPALSRQVLSRDMGCNVEGCSSRYRLEVHHGQPRSHGGGRR
jgi:hypothetical protein